MMKILALKSRRLGDTALWTSALDALCDFSTTELNADVDIAYPKPYKALFNEDTRFRKQIYLDPQILNWESLEAIRKEKYDFVLNFHASSRSALLSRASGAQTRVIHFHSRKSKRAFRSLEIPSLGIPMSAMERDLNVVRAVGWKGPSPSPRLILSTKFSERGHDLLRQSGLSFEKPIVGINMDASRPAKLWGDENYLSLCKKLCEVAQPAIFFEHADFASRPFYKEIKKFARTIHTPNLEDVLGCLVHTQLLVGSDSGLKHIAVALSIPTLTLFGPESVGEWHGYDEKIHRLIQIPVLCRNQDPEPKAFSWCGVFSCPYASHSCMSLISVDEVYKQASELFLPPG